MALIMQGRPILESPHAVTGFTGLTLLAFQAMLPRERAGRGARRPGQLGGGLQLAAPSGAPRLTRGLPLPCACPLSPPQPSVLL
jgi:hypothetical protein